MHKFASIVCLLAFAGPVLAQDKPVVPKPAGPIIHFPNPPSPKPTPIPVVPGSAFQLKQGVLYVVTSTAPIAVVSSPAGVVSVAAETGPLTIYGTFSDGSGFEKRTFTEPNLYIVQAVAKPGDLITSCELLAIKSLTDSKLVDRQAIAVDVPIPPDPPGPKPPVDPPITPLAALVQMAYTGETDPAKAVSAPRLAFLYEDIARTVVDDPKTATVNDLIRAIMTQRKALIGEGLAAVRAVLDKEFQSKLGAATVQMDAAERTAAKSVLNSAAQALKGVK